MSSIKQEFSRNARHYNQYNIIQKSVVAELIRTMPKKSKAIVDIGCGRGEVYAQLPWKTDSFTAVDFAEGMCALHPRAPEIQVIQGDFNDPDLFSRLMREPLDRVVSASALQWSVDLEKTFALIASMGKPVSLALFTSNTFASLHERLGVHSPLYGPKMILDLAQQYFHAQTFIKRYHLDFDSTQELLQYIKRSGVSSGYRRSGITSLRELIRDNTLRSIDAEVVFIVN